MPRFLVPVFHAAAGLGDLVGRHGRVTDNHHLVVGTVLVDHIHGRNPLLGSAHVVLPHRFVDAVVAIVVLQMLELVTPGVAQFPPDLAVPVPPAPPLATPPPPD